jgi:hypothetical protein
VVPKALPSSEVLLLALWSFVEPRSLVPKLAPAVEEGLGLAKLLELKTAPNDSPPVPKAPREAEERLPVLTEPKPTPGPNIKLDVPKFLALSAVG